ncbi:MAG: hypothetical protein EOO27_01715 [Comamonadaceae bacterium]|nr:MAG: hypothetical protein EOO27_01715 [Comamonadaceae bacterium]
MTEIKKATAAVVSQIAKSADDMQIDIWRLRAALGLPPSAQERAFVEFFKTTPEFKAIVKKLQAESPLETSYRKHVNRFDLDD